MEQGQGLGPDGREEEWQAASRWSKRKNSAGWNEQDAQMSFTVHRKWLQAVASGCKRLQVG